MGSWGYGAFENDAAVGWFEEVDDASLDQVRKALIAVEEVPSGDDPDADLSSAGVAAAALIAASRDGKVEALPAEAATWVETNRASVVAADIERARRVVMRVAQRSELQELFDEDRRNNEWHRVMDTLRARLS